jgi:hypothetical protein
MYVNDVLKPFKIRNHLGNILILAMTVWIFSTRTPRLKMDITG